MHNISIKNEPLNQENSLLDIILYFFNLCKAYIYMEKLKNA